MFVATVPTACGIETLEHQPLLPAKFTLQQCLPLAVLNLASNTGSVDEFIQGGVATVPTACGIETITLLLNADSVSSCNSAYRLRY